MNHVIVAGHLGADPEVRFTSSGQKVTTLRVAARGRRSGKEEVTIWWRVTIWGDQFDRMIPHFKKGSAIIVFGELSKPEIFTDREDAPQVSMNITAMNISFSPFGKGDQSSSPHQESSSPHQQEPSHSSHESAFGQGRAEVPAFNEDEIPF